MRTHSPHCRAGPGSTRAQVVQRGSGPAKRATQASHRRADGQLPQTAQRLGTTDRMWPLTRANQGWGMESIYSRRILSYGPRNTPHHRPRRRCALAAGRAGAVALAARGGGAAHGRAAGMDHTEALGLGALVPPAPGGARAHALLGKRFLPSLVMWSNRCRRMRSRCTRRWTGPGGSLRAGPEPPPAEAPPDAEVQMVWSNMALHGS